MMHFYYPSTSVACGADYDSLDTLPRQLTELRSEVTCLGCIEQLAKDYLICAACRGEKFRAHCCDPNPEGRGRARDAGPLAHRLTTPPARYALCGDLRAEDGLYARDVDVTCPTCKRLIAAGVRQICFSVRTTNGERKAEFMRKEKLDDLISDGGSLGNFLRDLILVD